MSTGDHTRHNREFWDADSDDYQAAHGAALAAAPLAWGAYRAPEDRVGALGPLADLAGRRVLELGCGAGQWAVALAAVGAAVTGFDLSAGQLAHARRAAPRLPLVLGDGEAPSGGEEIGRGQFDTGDGRLQARWFEVPGPEAPRIDERIGAA